MESCETKLLPKIFYNSVCGPAVHLTPLARREKATSEQLSTGSISLHRNGGVRIVE